MIFATKTYAQVGIGTTTPTEKLEVVGTVAVGTSVTVDPINYVSHPLGFTIVGTDPQSATVNGKIVAVETLYTPITIQPYTITNIYRDDINDLNLNIPADRYFITIANFEVIPGSETMAFIPTPPIKVTLYLTLSNPEQIGM
ncbi:hypothetical protein [Chryseobacterium indoltheticum]|uniref:hypothetical protein n=1 Tax=Chryseobacterium indoltheticum TaxID=254 RepID=UPI003F49221D